VQGSLDNPPVIVVTARWKILLLLFVAAFFSWMLFSIARHQHLNRLYFGAVLFGLCVPVMLWHICVPARLEISPSGITWFNGRKTVEYVWTDFADFRAYRPSSRAISKYVGYELIPQSPKRSRMTAVAHALAGVDGGFDGQWEMSADDLVTLLNQARAKWGRQA
jgi:hypothetical protein